MNRLTPSNALLPRIISDPIDRLRSDLDQMFASNGGRRLFDWAQPVFPAVNLEDRDGEFRLTAETPGYDRDSLELSCTGECLILKGQRSQASEHEEGGYIVNERNEGAFERQIPLPSRVDPAKIEATLNQGILQVIIPKVEDPQRKTIPIKISKEK